MNILVTGAKGQLGADVVKELSLRGIMCKGVDKDDFDITDKVAVVDAFQSYCPNAVIHCAAYTAVDKAEDEAELCRLINEEGTRNIALACREINAKLIYISTDYVFAGEGKQFYAPYDATAPLSVYGETKLAGEKAILDALEKVFIIRISWVFGINGNNFVKTMLKLGSERQPGTLNVVCDQIGSPTYTADLASLLCDMVVTEKYGMYHATNEGICSWAEFAEEVFRQAGFDMNVNHIPTKEYPTKAIRPCNSRLDKECLDIAGFSRMPDWKDALGRYMKEWRDEGGET